MVGEIRIIVCTIVVAALAVGGVGGVTTQQIDCDFPITVQDATGTEVTVASEPERVVTLGPASAQTMWEIGAREKVVGVSQYAEYLDGADERTNVSGPGNAYVSTETVVGLEPDLVLAENVIPNETIEQLRAAGVTVYKYGEATSIEDVYAKTELTGQLAGECAGATETVHWMNERISAVQDAVATEDRPRVLYTFFGYTAGEGTFIDEIIEVAGGDNVAADAGIEGYQQISDEIVVEADPEWLVLNSDDPTVPDTPAYRQTTAVRENQTVVVNANYVSQPAPRIVYPITKLARTFHADAFENETLVTTNNSAQNATTEAT